MREHDTDARVWYQGQIHEKQREANRLSIEVGLKAQDKADLGALAETVKRLDTAIGILEEAKTKLAV